RRACGWQEQATDDHDPARQGVQLGYARVVIRVLVLLVLAMPWIARADNPSLAEARKAIDEVRYDDARELLVQALKRGANRPEELVEIYKLSGATAAVLGPEELAEQY